MWEKGIIKFEVHYKPFVEERKEHHEKHVTIEGSGPKFKLGD
jgi:hypothetical protein